MKLCDQATAFVCAISLASTVQADPDRCATSLADAGMLMGRLQFVTQWRETTARDGRPLLLRIEEGGGPLRIEFVKTGEGRWADGPVRLCRSGARIVAQLERHELAAGEAMNWLMRQLLLRDPSFEIAPIEGGRLRVSAAGWSGDFEPLR